MDMSIVSNKVLKDEEDALAGYRAAGEQLVPTDEELAAGLFSAATMARSAAAAAAATTTLSAAASPTAMSE